VAAPLLPLRPRPPKEGGVAPTRGATFPIALSLNVPITRSFARRSVVPKRNEPRKRAPAEITAARAPRAAARNGMTPETSIPPKKARNAAREIAAAATTVARLRVRATVRRPPAPTPSNPEKVRPAATRSSRVSKHRRLKTLPVPSSSARKTPARGRSNETKTRSASLGRPVRRRARRRSWKVASTSTPTASVS